MTSPDRLEALREHGIGTGPNDDPVAIGNRLAQQGIAYRTADDVGLHQAGNSSDCTTSVSASAAACHSRIAGWASMVAR